MSELTFPKEKYFEKLLKLLKEIIVPISNYVNNYMTL